MCEITLKIKEKVSGFLKKYNLEGKNQKLFVGFSGGIDSACLLDVLSRLSQEYEFKLAAGHLNHNWRGEESLKEELAAKQFCVERNIEFYSETLSENLPRTEEEARNQRYSFFNKISSHVGATAIITGHTLSDQAETVLFRIIKGTGIKGLKGIPEVRFQDKFLAIYRPLLEISREENVEYCRENNITPNIDLSNFQEKYLRNRIRLNLIPELKTYNSEVETAVLRLSSVAKDSEEIIEEYLGLISKEIYSADGVISAKKFLKLSAALQKRVMFEFFIKNNIEYNYEKIEDALDFIKESSVLKSGNTLSLGKDVWLFASSSEIRIINRILADKSAEIVEVNLNGETFCPSLNLKIEVKPWDAKVPEKFPKETDKKVYADLSRVKTPLYLRTRKDGDVIQPFGMENKTKLKKYLINKGVPEFKRDELCLLADDEEVLWVVGVGISELLRAGKIPTHEIKVFLV